jgi:putative sporulation protein YtxC
VPLVSIGTSSDTQAIRRRLDFEFRFLEQEGLALQVNEWHHGKLNFLDLSLQRSPDAWANDTGLFKYYVANALSDVILGDCERALIDKLVRESHCSFTPEERASINSLAEEHLNSRPGATGIDPFPRIARKGRVLSRLNEFLETSNSVMLEGFITFRLREYIEELGRAVDRAVDDFLLEREYHEFIRLLKYFVDIQEPKIDEVHVVLGESGAFKLVDRQHNTISDAHLEEFVAEMVENEINHDDLLISALITVAPQRITLHCSEEERHRECIRTIDSVFAGRVSYCTGCATCRDDGGPPHESEA